MLFLSKFQLRFHAKYSAKKCYSEVENQVETYHDFGRVESRLAQTFFSSGVILGRNQDFAVLNWCKVKHKVHNEIVR